MKADLKLPGAVRAAADRLLAHQYGLGQSKMGDLEVVVQAALSLSVDHLAAVWDAGYRACNREWEVLWDISTADEDRAVARNPYRTEENNPGGESQ